METTDRLLHYFPDLSEHQLHQFNLLLELYTDWNQKINVISRKDIDHLIVRHFLHSLAIARYIRFQPGSEILDVGTGGGLPGIPLAIFFPTVKFHLVDSIAKKIKVVNAIKEVLDLKNVQAEQKRAEELKFRYDFVVSRAVTSFPEFIPWVANKIKPTQQNAIRNGILALKGGDLHEELQSIHNQCDIINLNQYFSEDFFDTKKLVHWYK